MMTISQISDALRENREAVTYADNADTLDFAEELDAQDQLRCFQDDFVRPTKAMIRKAKPTPAEAGKADDETKNTSSFIDTSRNLPTRGLLDLAPGGGSTFEARRVAAKYPSHTQSSGLAIYFCGNSLGLQPKAVREYVDTQLQTWAAIGVKGHFQAMESELGEEFPSPIKPWQEMAAVCSKQMARLVGAAPEEVVTMNTLTVNLHLMMASFYRPTATRHKIIAEWKPFPSDSVSQKRAVPMFNVVLH